MEIKATILLVDDEPKIITALKRILNNKMYKLLSATKSQDAIKIIDNEKVDIIICDYNMPELTGIDILRHCMKALPSSARILMTGLNDINIAISAINEGNVFYYFSKPWKSEEILSVVMKALDYKIEQEKKEILHDFMEFTSNRSIINSNKLLSTDKQSYSLKKVAVFDNDYIIILDIADIIYISAIDGGIYIYTKNKEFKSNDSLNSWDIKLENNNFFRCHRSYIVNVNKIEKISPWFNGAYNLSLKYIKESIPVSRSYSKELRSILNF